MLESLLQIFTRKREALPTSLSYDLIADWEEALHVAQYDFVLNFEQGKYEQALPAMRFVADQSEGGLMFVDFFVHDFFFHLVMDRKYDEADKMIQELQGKRYVSFRQPMDERWFRETLYERMGKEGALGSQGKVYWFKKLPRSCDFRKPLLMLVAEE